MGIAAGYARQRAPSEPSPGLDRVPVPLPKQADHIARLINDHGKQPGDVAAHGAHVKRFQLGNRSILATKHHLARRFTSEAHLRCGGDRLGYATQAAKAFLGSNGLKLESSGWAATARA